MRNFSRSNAEAQKGKISTTEGSDNTEGTENTEGSESVAQCPLSFWGSISDRRIHPKMEPGCFEDLFNYIFFCRDNSWIVSTETISLAIVFLELLSWSKYFKKRIFTTKDTKSTKEMTLISSGFNIFKFALGLSFWGRLCDRRIHPNYPLILYFTFLISSSCFFPNFLLIKIDPSLRSGWPPVIFNF